MKKIDILIVLLSTVPVLVFNRRENDRAHAKG
jgi:hypothetical protein